MYGIINKLIRYSIKHISLLLLRWYRAWLNKGWLLRNIYTAKMFKTLSTRTHLLTFSYSRRVPLAYINSLCLIFVCCNSFVGLYNLLLQLSSCDSLVSHKIYIHLHFDWIKLNLLTCIEYPNTYHGIELLLMQSHH